LKKQVNEIAIRREASLAAVAWQKLEAAAQSALNGNSETPSLRLVADTNGITAHVRDEHGTSVVIQGGKISVTVKNAETGV
jgi:hypothetical protein